MSVVVTIFTVESLEDLQLPRLVGGDSEGLQNIKIDLLGPESLADGLCHAEETDKLLHVGRGDAVAGGDDIDRMTVAVELPPCFDLVGRTHPFAHLVLGEGHIRDIDIRLRNRDRNAVLQRGWQALLLVKKVQGLHAPAAGNDLVLDRLAALHCHAGQRLQKAYTGDIVRQPRSLTFIEGTLPDVVRVSDEACERNLDDIPGRRRNLCLCGCDILFGRGVGFCHLDLQSGLTGWKKTTLSLLPVRPARRRPLPAPAAHGLAATASADKSAAGPRHGDTATNDNAGLAHP